MTDSREAREPPVSDRLLKLLDVMGIGSTYIDYGGSDVQIPLSDRLKVLQLMGIDPEDEAAVSRALEEHARLQPGNPLPRRTIVATESHQLALYFTPAMLARQYRWHLTTASGECLDGVVTGETLPEQGHTTVADQEYSLRRWSMPALAEGYHELTVSGDEGPVSAFIVRAPARCYEPDWLQCRQRLGGLSVQVFSLRSGRNWGMGDFTDLCQTIRAAAAQGVDFIVINPLHALDLDAPQNCSPYSPMDRRYLNPLYIDLEAVPEFAVCEQVRAQVAETAFRDRIQQLRDYDAVDYDAVAAIKLPLLAMLYTCFRDGSGSGGERTLDYQRWVDGKGSALQAYADFEARRHRPHSHQHGQLWRDPGFHSYLQFLADEQLRVCQELAGRCGMTLGLVRDLAVGGKNDSAEVLLNPGLFSTTASIGAPPDAFAPQGQNWGLPPLQPAALEASRFAHFIELVRDNMAHCGALRIDHVMALMRLWWCPGDDSGSAGAYVYYPVDALFAILRLESQYRRCVVIGEDLGVVPPEIRRHIEDSAVISNLLFYFEKYDSIHFRHPRDYQPMALAMVANHDVPTLKAWWDRSDLELRRSIGLLDGDAEYDEMLKARESDLIQILHWLQEQGLLPAPWQDFNIHRPFDVALCRALLVANGHAASVLVSTQLADLLLMETPVNIPGTASEYPNWRTKLPVAVDEVFTIADSLNMLSAFVAARRGPD